MCVCAWCLLIPWPDRVRLAGKGGVIGIRHIGKKKTHFPSQSVSQSVTVQRKRFPASRWSKQLGESIARVGLDWIGGAHENE